MQRLAGLRGSGHRLLQLLVGIFRGCPCAALRRACPTVQQLVAALRCSGADPWLGVNGTRKGCAAGMQERLAARRGYSAVSAVGAGEHRLAACVRTRDGALQPRALSIGKVPACGVAAILA